MLTQKQAVERLGDWAARNGVAEHPDDLRTSYSWAAEEYWRQLNAMVAAFTTPDIEHNYTSTAAVAKATERLHETIASLEVE